MRSTSPGMCLRAAAGPMATGAGEAAGLAQEVMQAEEIAAVFGGGRRQTISGTFHNCIFVLLQKITASSSRAFMSCAQSQS